jgi:hypothetical protein
MRNEAGRSEYHPPILFSEPCQFLRLHRGEPVPSNQRAAGKQSNIQGVLKVLRRQNLEQETVHSKCEFI